MALDKVLKVYDDNGNEIDYDILASDVKFLPDGKDLPTKLAELEDEIGQGSYAPPAGGIPKTDLAQSVQDSLDKADSALQDEDVAGLATKTELNTKQDALVAGDGITIAQDGKTVSVAESIRTGAGKGATAVQSVTVESEEDGTVDIHVDDDTYSINLNHTHPNMCKLIVCEESDLPSTLDEDTIYGVNEDGEIAMLYVGGIPFYGGGGAVSGPVLRRPADGSAIDMGETVNGSVSKTINVKGRNLTQALTIELDGTGYTFGNQQPSGVTIVSTTELTITAGAANALNGVDIVVVYAGSDTDENASGTLGITSNDNISVEATLVANKVTYEDLAGVKFTGSQWLQTDYYPNPNTEFVFKLRLEDNVDSDTTTGSHCLMRTGYVTNGPYRFSFYIGAGIERWHIFAVTDTNQNPKPADLFLQTYNQDLYANPSTLSFVKGNPGTLTFSPTGGTAIQINLTAVGLTSQTPMAIGYNSTNQNVFHVLDLTIFELTITENGSPVRHWVPKTKNGIAGLYDTVSNKFISSETSTDLVAIHLTNNN